METISEIELTLFPCKECGGRGALYITDETEDNDFYGEWFVSCPNYQLDKCLSGFVGFEREPEDAAEWWNEKMLKREDEKTKSPTNQ